MGDDGNADGAGDIMMGRDNHLAPKHIIEGGNDSFIEGCSALKEYMIADALAANNAVEVIIYGGIGQAGEEVIFLSARLLVVNEV